jgi:hypothetical protein
MAVDPTSVIIGFPIDQFVIFIIAVVGAIAGIIIWVYKLTHPLDVALTALTTRVNTLERNFTDRDREFRDIGTCLPQCIVPGAATTTEHTGLVAGGQYDNF